MLGNNFSQFCKDLMESSCYDDSFLVYSRYINSLSFEACSYVFMVDVGLRNDTTPPRFSLSANFSSSFMDEYVDQGLQNSDYIVDGIRNHSWSDQSCIWKHDRKQVSLKQKKMIELATDYGMGNSLTILSKKSVLGVGATTLVGDVTDQYLEEHLREIKTVTEIFNNHVVVNNYSVTQFLNPMFFGSLNKLEKLALIELAKGLKIPAIASKLHKSKGYIENVVSSIRAKVGGVTETGAPKITVIELVHYYLMLNPLLEVKDRYSL